MLTRVVGRIRQGLPPHVRVEEDDLRSYGVIGMYKAIERFDPDLGFAFDKFASNFIRGAVLDELRSQDWAPRSLRKRQKDMEKSKQELTKQLHRSVTDEEIAESLKWTVHDVSHTRKQIDTAWPRSLDEIRGATEKDLHAVVADIHGSPEEHVMETMAPPENDRSALLSDKMASFIESMPPQKRAVAIFCYYLGMRQGDVAAVLGVPESRVSNLHLSIMEDIHNRLHELLVEHD
jgi:RNA polymerase sigma factor for flagellar operon FliA